MTNASRVRLTIRRGWKGLLLFTALWTAVGTSHAAFGTPAGADSLTVHDAVRMALDAAPSIARAEAVVRAAEARGAQVRATRAPDVDIIGRYDRIGPVPTFDLPGLGSFALFPEDNPDAHIEASYMLYDFGRVTAAENAAGSRVREAAHDIDAARTDIAFRTIRTFRGILFLRQSVIVEEGEIATLNAHLDINRKKVAAGTATEFDVLSTQARIAAADTRRIDIAAELTRQEITLRRLLGIADSAPLALRGSFDARPLEATPDSLVAEALRERVELAAAREQERTAALDLRTASLGMLPTVSVHAAWGVKNGYIPNLNVMHGNWDLGATLRVPLYEGGFKDARMREAEAVQRAAEARSDDLAREIRAEVLRAWADVAAARDRIASADVAVARAREALAIAQKRYSAGAGSNIDVLDAETELAQADLIHLRAQYTHLLALTELDRTAGRHIWEMP